MKKLAPLIHDTENGLDYILVCYWMSSVISDRFQNSTN